MRATPMPYARRSRSSIGDRLPGDHRRGEQRKPSFVTYPIDGLDGPSCPTGSRIPFEDGHTRQLPRLSRGPFRYQAYSKAYLEDAKRSATRPVKQAVISASALSLLYPPEGIDGYSRDQFLSDLVDESETDIRGSLDLGAHCVQIDFTEARLSLKLDPSGGLLRTFVDLNNQVLGRFSPRSGRASASTPAPVATATRPTAPTSTTPSCCRRSLSSRSGASTSSSQASRIGAGCSARSRRTCARGNGSSSV